MRFLSMILWVTQFGLSVLFPTCFFLFLAYWLVTALGTGMWVMAVLGMTGLLTSFSTARSCIRSMLREMERQNPKTVPPSASPVHRNTDS